MELYSDYSNIIVNSFLKLREGDSLSINTEESDFEFAKVLADASVRVTKTPVKIVLTENGRPSEVVDFDPYDTPVQSTGFCMLHLKHTEEQAEQSNDYLDVIVEKDDLKAIQKLGHLAEPIILDRRIAIPWCVVPSYNVNSPELADLVGNLSKDIEGQILAVDYRKKFLNHADIDFLHVFGDNCDFTVAVPENNQFIGGSTRLGSGRDFVSGTDFGNVSINIDKNSINGWFVAKTRILGRFYELKFEFKNGKISKVSECSSLRTLFSFDFQLTKPGSFVMNDKHFELVFGGATVDSLVNRPDSVEELPDWFNSSLYKFSCVLDKNLNIGYVGCDKVEHELVRKGFFLE